METEKGVKMLQFRPDEHLLRRFYRVKSKKLDLNPGYMPDSDVHKEVFETGLKILERKLGINEAR